MQNKLLWKKPSSLVDKNIFLPRLFIVFLAFPHLKPSCISLIPLLEAVFNAWRLISFLIILFLCLRYKHISVVSFVIGIIEIYLIVITFMNDTDLKTAVINAFSVLSISLLFDYYSDDTDNFLVSQLLCFEIVIYINLITEIMYPETMYTVAYRNFVNYKNYFLGYYNNHTKYFIPALMIAALYVERTGKKLRAIFLTGTIIISVVLVWSGGTLMTVFVMLALYILSGKGKIRINYFAGWITQVVFFFSIAILKLQYFLKWLIDGILLKWGSIEGRIKMWDAVLELIAKNPIFGYGITTGDDMEARLGVLRGVHAHNLLMQVFYEGGLIYFILFIVLILFVGIKLSKRKDSRNYTIISIAFFGWSVATLVEPFTSPFLMGMFVIAYHYGMKRVIKQEDQVILSAAN